MYRRCSYAGRFVLLMLSQLTAASLSLQIALQSHMAKNQREFPAFREIQISNYLSFVPTNARARTHTHTQHTHKNTHTHTHTHTHTYIYIYIYTHSDTSANEDNSFRNHIR